MEVRWMESPFLGGGDEQVKTHLAITVEGIQG